MMKEMEQAKQVYEQTEIPPELSRLMNSCVEQSRIKQIAKKPRLIAGKVILSLAAALLLAFTAVLNSSTVFAKEMAQLPVLGTLAKVLTIRSYEENDENARITAEVPAIVEENTEVPSPAITDINSEIARIVDEYLALGKQHAEEYRKAFLETGGTEEEWADHNIAVTVDYETKLQNGHYLSLVLYLNENWYNAGTQTYYYNLDLLTGNTVTLKDLLGQDYISLANDSIRKQMQERLQEDPDLNYFDESMGGFTSITDSTPFYLSPSGNPVIVFAKYEIAPGAFGSQEFEVAP